MEIPARLRDLTSATQEREGTLDFIRSLAAKPPALVAAAFELQVVPNLPTSETDQRVDLVVTESGEYRRGGS